MIIKGQNLISQPNQLFVMKDFAVILKDYKLFSFETLLNYYYQTTNNTWFIFDLQTDKCVYMDLSIKNITGFESVEYFDKGIVYFIKSVINSSDIQDFISEFIAYIRKRPILTDLQSNELIKHFSFRIKHKNGSWQKIHGKSIVAFKSNIFEMPDILIGFIYQELNNNRSLEPADPATYREIEVLKLVGNGDSSKVIANKLHISETTVISHRKNLIQKFQVRNTAELIKKAVKENIIE